jgi:hypothetical protein
LRLPPTLTCSDAEKLLKDIVYSKKYGGFDHTFGAEVEICNFDGGEGFDAPKIEENLSKKIE